jgi:hypothetical protein
MWLIFIKNNHDDFGAFAGIHQLIELESLILGREPLIAHSIAVSVRIITYHAIDVGLVTAE